MSRLFRIRLRPEGGRPDRDCIDREDNVAIKSRRREECWMSHRLRNVIVILRWRVCYLAWAAPCFRMFFAGLSVKKVGAVHARNYGKCGGGYTGAVGIQGKRVHHACPECAR